MAGGSSKKSSSDTHDADGGATARELRKRVKHTNIVVVKSALDGIDDAQHALLHRIAADDAGELAWWHHTLRPPRCLVHPSVAFLHGIKALRPAAAFHTFDAKKAKLRRMAKQVADQRRARARRARQMAPTAALRAALNPHAVPRNGGRATADELPRNTRRRGKTTATTTATTTTRDDAARPAYFTKWRKAKLRKIGKGL